MVTGVFEESLVDVRETADIFSSLPVDMVEKRAILAIQDDLDIIKIGRPRLTTP